MTIKVDADIYEINSDDWTQKNVDVEIPGVCGRCGKSGIQKFMALTLVQGPWGEEPSGMLETYCAACHNLTVHIANYNGGIIMPFISFPQHETEGRAFSDYVKEKYESFVNIYRQSEKAENQGLNLICGVGYRKAVEFLVSDFLITEQCLDKEWVENPKTTLGAKIKKIEDPKMEKLARAITWIGNDETHYTRRHPEQDVDGMKKFTDALLITIEYNKAYNDAIQFTENEN